MTHAVPRNRPEELLPVRAAALSPTLTQLRALVALRWRMVRSRRSRLGFAALGAFAVVLLAAGIGGALLLPRQTAFNATLLTPTAFLVFAALAVVSPLAAGGGYDLFPADQLSALPVRPATSYGVTLLVAPLNVAWLVQVTGLLALTAYVVGPVPGLVAALALTVLYVVAMVIAGQSVAWLVVGVRRTRTGRRVTWTLAAVLMAAAVVVLQLGAHRVLDHAPTRPVVLGVLGAGAQDFGPWARAAVGLVVLAAVALRLGVRATAWALRRPDDSGMRREAGDVRRRGVRRSVGAELRAIDRASVWRAPALRRGALVIALMPGLVGAAVGLSWDSIAVTAGLVAAGAGLLFGVNVFCLDGSGALWLASLPHPPRVAYLAKARVLVETCLGAAALAVAASAVRATHAPTAAEATAVVASVCCCTALVVGTCLRLSVHRPHRAELRGRRDTPAPPGVMAAYSVRLATMTTVVALLVASTAVAGRWWLPLALGGAIGALGVSSALRTLHQFEIDEVRARVAVTVSTG